MLCLNFAVPWLQEAAVSVYVFPPALRVAFALAENFKELGLWSRLKA